MPQAVAQSGGWPQRKRLDSMPNSIHHAEPIESEFPFGQLGFRAGRIGNPAYSSLATNVGKSSQFNWLSTGRITHICLSLHVAKRQPALPGYIEKILLKAGRL